MNILNTNRVVFWILIFLVMVNITALATFFIYMRKPASEPVPGSGYKKGIALRRELALSPDQSVEVNKINYTYQAATEPIVTAIREKKAQILDELSKEDSDTALVAKLAGEILDEQKKLQMANIKQFIDLKKVCTPEQTQKLSQIYAELYGFDARGKGQRKGYGNGKGNRHQYGQQKDTLNQ